MYVDRLKEVIEKAKEDGVPDSARFVVQGFTRPKESFNQVVVDITEIVDLTMVRMVPDTPLHVIHTTFKQLGLRICTDLEKQYCLPKHFLEIRFNFGFFC